MQRLLPYQVQRRLRLQSLPDSLSRRNPRVVLPRNVFDIYPGVAAEANFYFSSRSRLGAKVIVADTREAYKRICWHGICEPLGRSTAAQTSDLWGADPLFFAVMLFERKSLCLEYVIHECVHAAAFYWKRRRNTPGVLDRARGDDERRGNHRVRREFPRHKAKYVANSVEAYAAG